MSSDVKMKGVYNALMPPGEAWRLKIDDDLDHLFDGVADNDARMRDFLNTLDTLRNPYLCDIDFLPDLEKEYGITTDESLTETERREQLAAIVYAHKGTGSRSYLEDRLHQAGFTNLFVYNNDPAVNPNQFIDEQHAAWCDKTDSVCGNENAFCAEFSGGEYVVNGDIFFNTIEFTSVCGNEAVVCGNSSAVCGNFRESKDFVNYTIPDSDEPVNILLDGNMELTTIPDWDPEVTGNILPDGNMEVPDLTYWVNESAPVDGSNVFKSSFEVHSGSLSIQMNSGAPT
jgi:hypothetical protein